jgi:hypothetical protein
LRAVTRLSAVVVSPELMALWSDLRKSEIVFPELVLPLLVVLLVLLVLASLLDDDEFEVCERMPVKMLWAVVVSPDSNALLRELRSFSNGFSDEEPSVESEEPAPGGAGGGLEDRYCLRDDSALSAVEVSPEERALWIDFKSALMVSLGLELSEELEEFALGEWERRFDKTLWAVDVSPDSRALSKELSAFSSGLPVFLLVALAVVKESELLS